MRTKRERVFRLVIRETLTWRHDDDAAPRTQTRTMTQSYKTELARRKAKAMYANNGHGPGPQRTVEFEERDY